MRNFIRLVINDFYPRGFNSQDRMENRSQILPTGVSCGGSLHDRNWRNICNDVSKQIVNYVQQTTNSFRHRIFKGFYHRICVWIIFSSEEATCYNIELIMRVYCITTGSLPSLTFYDWQKVRTTIFKNVIFFFQSGRRVLSFYIHHIRPDMCILLH